MTMPFETAAKFVRTGHVITDGHRNTLHVAVVHHATHDGTPVVWFSGWTGHGVWVERGWGQQPDTRVVVAGDHQGADTYLEVSAGVTTEEVGA